ncbi:MAG: pyroglutamyl-peptidase I [Candidatus Heimdallarchaeota archaeon]|nr:pyroglutamyl-peptidase I [Candidatus Heimdallarchaeota archaeon]
MLYSPRIRIKNNAYKNPYWENKKDNTSIGVFKMKKLLLTGFEPFGGYEVNPSELIARDFDGYTISDIKISGRVIPLKFNEIYAAITTNIKEISPNFIINLGQAPRPAISFEKVAINLANAQKVAYNCGTTPDDEILIKEGPLAYFSSLPLKFLVQYLEKHKIPSYISYSAGTFGCNQIFYYSMHHVNNSPPNQKVLAGFIHLPLLPEQALSNPNSPSMSLESMKNAIKLVITYLGQQSN